MPITFSREMPAFARFWMICRKPAGPGAKTEPRACYHCRADAEADARRLACDTGAPFLILESVATVFSVTDAEQEPLL